MTRRSHSTLTCIAVAAFLGACGGSGGDSGPSADGPGSSGQPNADAVWKSVLDGGRSYTVSGPYFNLETNRPDTLESTVVFDSRASAPSLVAGLADTSKMVVRTSGRFLSEPQTVTNGPPFETYFTADYALQGHVSSNGCTVVSHVARPPTSAAIGSGGKLADASPQSRCSANSGPSLASYTSTWSVARDGAFVFLCWTLEGVSATNQSLGTSSHCFEIEQGSRIGARFQVRTSDGINPVILRNYPAP
jgi:hypothetical protein